MALRGRGPQREGRGLAQQRLGGPLGGECLGLTVGFVHGCGGGKACKECSRRLVDELSGEAAHGVSEGGPGGLGDVGRPVLDGRGDGVRGRLDGLGGPRIYLSGRYEMPIHRVVRQECSERVEGCVSNGVLQLLDAGLDVIGGDGAAHLNEGRDVGLQRHLSQSSR